MKSWLKDIITLKRFISKLPKRTSKLMDKLEEGTLKIDVEDTDEWLCESIVFQFIKGGKKSRVYKYDENIWFSTKNFSIYPLTILCLLVGQLNSFSLSFLKTCVAGSRLFLVLLKNVPNRKRTFFGKFCYNFFGVVSTAIVNNDYFKILNSLFI